MAYILAQQRHLPALEAGRLWQDYRAYVRGNQSRFPPGAFALATSDWYYALGDPRGPHDAWLVSAIFEEPATGPRSENRRLSLRVRLLGAFHDRHLEFFYSLVHAYSFSNAASAGGHADWRYDEFRLADNGHLVHEIEWAGGPGIEARWLIEASDVQFTTRQMDMPALDGESPSPGTAARIFEPDSQTEASLNAFLDDRIYDFNMQATGLRDGRALAGVIRDDAGGLVAAINGHTWGGCCHVVHLWVHEARRRAGLGRALLLAAEQEAMRRGCAQVLLATHSFQAPGFYEDLGYARQASVPGYPQGHAQFVYVKALP